MTEASVAEFGAAQAGEAPLRELMDPVTRFLAQASGEHFTGGVGDHLPDADVDALGRGDEANVLAAGLRDALSAGNDGFIDDEFALMTNWGFDLQNVHVPVTIWHGEQTATCASDTDGSSPNSSTAPRSTSCPATASTFNTSSPLGWPHVVPDARSALSRPGGDFDGFDSYVDGRASEGFVVDDGLVIVGASLAGAKAAEGARRAGWDGPIRLVGAEPHLPYERPPLSKGVLIGRDSPAVAFVHDAGFEVTEHVDLLLGAEATAVDLGSRRVELAGGRTLRFAKLVLATGSSPRRLGVSGADLTGVFTLRGLDDCLSLRDRLLPGRKVVVVGGSWIGTEVAACARQRGCDVVIVDPLGTPLERVLGAQVGGWYADLHSAHGVELRMGVGVDALVGGDAVAGVRLTDGTTVDAEVVVTGIGVTPNLALAASAGLAVDRGVLCDSTLVTSHPDVLVAGDIAEAEHPLLGQRVRVEHWATALNQGLTAGANAAGRSDVYDRIPYFYSDQYDSGMEYSGWPVPWDDVVFRGDPNDGQFIAFYLREKRVVAGICVNVWDVNVHVQEVIRAGGIVPVDVLTDVDVDPQQWPTATEADLG